MKIGVLLEAPAKHEQGVLGERRAHYLQSDWHVLGKTTGKHEGGEAA